MMRPFIIAAFALVTFLGIPHFAFAADTVCTSAGQACTFGGVNGTCAEDQENGGFICTGSAINAASPLVDPAAAKTVTENKDTKDEAYGYVMQKIMSLFAWLLGVAALTLNYAVYYTVVTMGNYVSHLTAIGVAWRVLRDLGNIMLIFGFLAIGITTILNVDWYGGGKKMLPMLLVAAVFLNFSLFISEAVIDTGNLFATQFYAQINGGVLPTTTSGVITTSTGDALTPGNEGISNKIMSQLGLQTIYGDATRNTAIFKAGNTWLIGFMGIILFMVAAFVMFSLAFILIARFVILIFLIVLAPVGFAGLAVPQLAKRAGQWWEMLFEQTITAPVLLLMLYVALAVITDASFLTGFGTSSAGNSGAATGFVDNANLPGFAGFVLSFLVAMGLLLAVTITAKKLSAFGAGFATKTAGKLTFGLTAAGMRSTAGWGSQRAAAGWRKMGLSRAPVIGRAVSSVLDRGAKASFDVRGTGVLKKLPFGGVDAGTAQKGGFREWEKTKIKERETYAKDLEQTTGKFLGIKYAEGEKGRQEAAEDRLKELKAAYEAAKTPENKRAMDEVQAEIDILKRAPQEGYAKGLELGLDKDSFFNKVVNPLRNTKAAENIRKEAKKSKAEKDFENFKKLIEEKAKEEKPKEEKSEEKKPEAAH